MRARVLITTSFIPDYRVGFFNALHRRLADEGIRLEVLCGTAGCGDGFREEDVAPAGVERRRLLRLGRRLHWLPGAIRRARVSDITILDEGIASLHNHVILLLRRLGIVHSLAFWGHGWDFLHGETAGPLCHFRRWERQRADRWFAYTSMSADKLTRQGFPTDRLTVVNNSTDVTSLRTALSAVAPERTREVLGSCFGSAIEADALLAVFCSRLSAHKDIDFMLATAEALHRSLPPFRLIIIGAGARQRTAEAFCRERPWCAYAGAVHGKDRTSYLKRADVWLTSGAVGLEVVDAMAAGIPLVIRAGCGHGPEMAYVEPGRNAAVFGGDADAYAGQIAALLTNQGRLRDMRAAAWKTGDGLGVEVMAEQFAKGIDALLRERPTATGTGKGQ